MLQRTDRLSVGSKGPDEKSGSVWIPVAELPTRVHELPPPGSRIRLNVRDDGAAEAAGFLTGRGYDVDRAAFDDVEPGRFRLWSPNPSLEKWLVDLTAGTALDFGCGSGRDSVFMADRGWQVTGIDRLPDAISLAKELDRRYLQGTFIDWRVERVERFEATPVQLAIVSMGPSMAIWNSLDSIIDKEGHLFVEAYRSDWDAEPPVGFRTLQIETRRRSRGEAVAVLFQRS